MAQSVAMAWFISGPNTTSTEVVFDAEVNHATANRLLQAKLFYFYFYEIYWAILQFKYLAYHNK